VGIRYITGHLNICQLTTVSLEERACALAVIPPVDTGPCTAYGIRKVYQNNHDKPTIQTLNKGNMIVLLISVLLTASE